MNSIVSSIGRRAKKLLIILIILPLLAGVVGYIMEVKTPPTYTAKATLELGNFQNEDLTNPDKVANDLKKVGKLKAWTKNSNADAVASHLTIIENPTSNIVHVEYNGTSLTEAKNTLTLIINGFLDESNALLRKKRDIINNEIEGFKNNPQLDVNQTSKLADAQMTSVDYRATDLYENVTASSGYVNPLKRGLFGVIVGLMLDIIILVLPELFRDFR